MADRNSFWVPAVLALVGVVIGGAITGGLTVWNADHERDIAASDSRRQAVRLVVVEIGEISLQLQALRGIAKWDTRFIRRSWPLAMPNEAWKTYGPTLAVYLRSSPWLALSLFYRNVDQARNGFVAFAVIPPESRRAYRALHTEAQELLRRFGRQTEPS